MPDCLQSNKSDECMESLPGTYAPHPVFLPVSKHSLLPDKQTYRLEHGWISFPLPLAFLYNLLACSFALSFGMLEITHV